TVLAEDEHAFAITVGLADRLVDLQQHAGRRLRVLVGVVVDQVHFHVVRGFPAQRSAQRGQGAPAFGADLATRQVTTGHEGREVLVATGAGVVQAVHVAILRTGDAGNAGEQLVGHGEVRHAIHVEAVEAAGGYRETAEGLTVWPL